MKPWAVAAFTFALAGTAAQAKDVPSDFRVFKAEGRDLASAQASGTQETVTLPAGEHGLILIDKDNIRLVGEDREKVIVKGIVLQGRAGVTIENLSIVAAEDSVVENVAIFKQNLIMPVTVKPVLSSFALAVLDSRDITVVGVDVRGTDVGIVFDNVLGFNLYESTIRGNAEGVSVHRSTGDIARNLIRDNDRVHSWDNRISGRGIEIGGGSQLSIQSNTIVNNRSHAGRKSRTNGRGILSGIAWSANSWKNVGPKPLSYVTIENNIVTGHDVDIFPTPRVSYNAVSMRIIEKNKPTHCFIEIAGHPGHLYQPKLNPTNLLEKPMFVDPDKGDFRLRPDSPLKNRGRDGTYIGAFPSADLEKDHHAEDPAVP